MSFINALATGPETQQKKKGIFSSIAELLMPRFPDLRDKLRLADMKEMPFEVLEKVVRSTVFLSGFIILFLGLIFFVILRDTTLLNFGKNATPIIVSAIIVVFAIPYIVFSWLMLYPSAMASKRRREMDYEVVFAGRHIAIAIRSGMPLFEAFVGASKSYGLVSKEIGKIVDKVVLGVPIAQAIRETTQQNPSKYFNRMMIQIANSLSSGADVGGALEGVLNQITKEQFISIREYSQKLTPMVMFYMIFGIVVPSLGVVLLTVIVSAISSGKMGFSVWLLPAIFVVITLVQLLFLGLIESSRPKYLI